jgi:hypothetical protein
VPPALSPTGGLARKDTDPRDPGRMRGYCILAVAAGCRGRGLAGFFAAGSKVTTTGLGLKTGEGAVVKLPSDMVECTVIVCGT